MVQDNGKEETLALKLRVRRQRRGQPGAFEDHAFSAMPTSAPFLEMMGMLNEQLIKAGEEPLLLIMTAAKVSVACVR